MRKIVFPLTVLLFLLAACAGGAEPTVSPPTHAVEPTRLEINPSPEQTPIEPSVPPEAVATIAEATEVVTEQVELPSAPVPFEGDPLPTDRGDYFSASGACSLCHTDMADKSGADVLIDSYWRSTMMANAARDPYWVASVRSETLSNPGLEQIIEDKCTTCHMPMARTTVAIEGQPGMLFEDGFLEPDNPHHTLALDGVSCTLCHQVEAENFGDDDSFSGGFLIDSELPRGERVNYGPYPVEEALGVVMQTASGFIPQQGTHIQESELCATCHTLYTPTINEDGEITGLFPEQMAYFEWLNSGHAQENTCQDCHMPIAEGGVQLSITGGEPRSPFSKHAFVGGNAYMLGVLGSYGTDLGVTSSSEQIEATIDRVLDQMQTNTAEVSIDNLEVANGELIVDVVVQNLTGHKFPTGYPSRRAWLHLIVLDADGQVIFESGAWSLNGEITDNENDLDASRYELHHVVIDDPSQVQIYESIIEDENGEVTSELLRGVNYIKDNRLLPDGFNPRISNPDIAVYGTAAQDTDFTGGSDTVRYEIAVDPTVGPFTVQVDLLYQSIAYRWAVNLTRHTAVEIDNFLRYYQSLPNSPVVVSQVSVETK